MDARDVQNLLMKSRIPQKRTANERRKQHQDDSESDDDTRGQTQIITGTGEDGNLSDGSGIQAPPLKRRNTAGMEMEYDSPAEDHKMAGATQVTNPNLAYSIAASIESAKSLPISKHK